MLRELCALFLLTNSSYSDIKERKISLFSLVGFLLLGITCNVFGIQRPFTDMTLSLLPGLILVIISIISGGRLGMGDALVIIVLGVFFGCSRVFEILVMSVFISGIYSALMLILGKKCIKDEFPFIPFLLASYVILIAL